MSSMAMLGPSPSLMSPVFRDANVVQDTFGGLEITIVATMAVALICISLVVVVIARCRQQRSSDHESGVPKEQDAGSTAPTPVSLVKRPEDQPADDTCSVVWQDVPNCFVPDTCTLPRNHDKDKQRNGTPARQKSSTSLKPSSPLHRPSALKARHTPEQAAHSETTDVDSVFGAITPMHTMSMESIPASQSVPSVAYGGQHRANKTNSMKRLSGGQVSAGHISLDGPEYGAQRPPGSDPVSVRSSLLGSRQLTRSPLSGNPSPAHGTMTSGTSGQSTLERTVQVYPGSRSPALRPASHNGSYTGSAEHHRRAHASDDPYRQVDDHARLLVPSATSSHGNLSPTGPHTQQHQQLRPTLLPGPEVIYSYDALKAEVDALRKQVSMPTGARESASLPRHQSANYTADV